MTSGATVISVLIVPLARQLGSPSAGLGTIGILALTACLGFLPIALHAHRHAPALKSTHVSPWPSLRTRTGIMITAGFTGRDGTLDRDAPRRRASSRSSW